MTANERRIPGGDTRPSTWVPTHADDKGGERGGRR